MMTTTTSSSINVKPRSDRTAWRHIRIELAGVENWNTGPSSIVNIIAPVRDAVWTAQTRLDRNVG
jgi:hypothetical protein